MQLSCPTRGKLLLFVTCRFTLNKVVSTNGRSLVCSAFFFSIRIVWGPVRDEEVTTAMHCSSLSSFLRGNHKNRAVSVIHLDSPPILSLFFLCVCSYKSAISKRGNLCRPSGEDALSGAHLALDGSFLACPSVHPLMHRGSSELHHQHPGSNHRRGTFGMQGGTWSAENKGQERAKRAKSLRNTVIIESVESKRRGSPPMHLGEDKGEGNEG